MGRVASTRHWGHCKSDIRRVAGIALSQQPGSNRALSHSRALGRCLAHGRFGLPTVDYAASPRLPIIRELAKGWS